MTPKDINNDNTNQDDPFPEEFGDDLNEDWESAFQTDDSTFSQDNKTEDLFSSADEGTEGVDLGSLAATKPEEQPASEPADKQDSPPQKEKKRFLDLPRWQRVVLLTIPLLALTAGAVYFLSPPLAPPPQKQTDVAAQAEKGPQSPADTVKKQQESETMEQEEDLTPPSADSANRTFHGLPDTKIRRRHNLPPIFVTATNGDNEALFVSVDITLLLDIAPDQALTEKDKIMASDIIYQFFKNRPAEELADYTLNRGKMIQKIADWLGKNWPQGPLHSVIVDSYRVNKS